MLYQKMEENSNLQRKLESAQLQQVMFLTQMMQQNPSAPTPVPAQQPVASGLAGLLGSSLPKLPGIMGGQQ